MKRFEPTLDSLRTFECPEWFQDAKLGIWSHWGPQSVPMCGDWYARHIYVQGSPQYLYHVRHYGHPSQFGYKDICALWKAENFDPDGLMDLYYQAGARYFVAQASHHDHFFNYPSKLNRMNSVEIGPHKDICGLWQTAAQKYNLPFGLSEHLGASFSWWNVNKGSDAYGPYKGVPYDGNDPNYRDFYHDNAEHFNGSHMYPMWYTTNERFRRYWLECMKELIDLYHPDLLYTDGGIPFGEQHDWGQGDSPSPEDPAYQHGLEAIAYLYNDSVTRHGSNRAIYTQKDRRPDIYKVGVLDIEKSQLPGVFPDPWQTDTCIGNWFYDAKQNYKTPDHIIEILVDIVAKNGVMLLNILQRPDGSIDDEARYILEELAGWYAICGEAIYGTRPFRIASEGDTRVKIEGFSEEKTAFNSSDWRFTTKGGKLYAFMMAAPENRIAVLKSITETVKSVSLLGHGPVEFTQNFGIVTVRLPEQLPTPYTNCLQLQI